MIENAEMNPLIQQSIEVLAQLKLYLQAIDQTQYTTPIVAMYDGTLGQHTRHIIEFYQCLMEQAPQHTINYCKRRRDLQMETNTIFAMEVIDQLIRHLPALPMDNDLSLEMDKEGTIALSTNTPRELFYAMEHCIHHMAIIKIGLKLIAPNISLPKTFGVAPATIQYRKELANGKKPAST